MPSHRFNCCDLDGDGALSPEEMRHFYRSQVARVTSLVKLEFMTVVDLSCPGCPVRGVVPVRPLLGGIRNATSPHYAPRPYNDPAAFPLQGQESIQFQDVLCQMIDMVRPKNPLAITLGDMLAPGKRMYCGKLPISCWCERRVAASSAA